jgi:hypothetical protein
VVKVPEKFGFNWSKFGWFGHFTEHVKGEELGFLGNGHLRWKCPPEGARNLQWCLRHTKEHIPQQEISRFHRNSQIWKRCEKEWRRGKLNTGN